METLVEGFGCKTN